MRVCYVCGNLYPLLAGRTDIPVIGGAEVQQHLVAGALAERGVETVFVTEDFGQGADVVLGGRRVLSYRYGRNKARQAMTLWTALRRAGADLYYVNGAPKFLGLIWLFCALRKRPLVIGMSTNQMVHRGAKTGLSRWQQAVYAWSLSRAAAVVALTEYQRRELERNYGLRRVAVVPNGIPEASVMEADPARARTVLWIASLTPYKGVERLFDLAARLPDLRFEIVGGPARGHIEYERAMRERAAGVSNVLWRGPVPNREIDTILTGALALVNTTGSHQGVEHLEGFPITYLEAWRCGVPVLTLDNDPDEIICREGLGCHSRTVVQMAEDLARLAADPAMRARIGEAGRACVSREFGLEQVTSRTLALFHRAVGKG